MKTKICILTFMILLAGFIVRVIKTKNNKSIIKNIYYVLPELVLLAFTFCAFMPSSLYLSNIQEFSVGYEKIVLVIIAATLFIIAGGIMFVGIINNMVFTDHFKMFLFSLGVGFYLQSNFLNPKLPELNGIEIDWNQYKLQGIISITVWLVCIIGLQIALLLWKNKLCKITKFVSIFLSAVQLVTLVVLIISTSNLNSSSISLTKNDEFTIGSEKNIVIFVLDSFGSSKFEDMVSQNDDMQQDLQDFTFFRNAVSGGAYTSVAMPVLLTGVEFDPTWQSYEDYLKDAWTNTNIYSDLKKQDFDIRIYSDSRYITSVSNEIISNAESVGKGYEIENYKSFTKALYKLSCFYSMPLFLKQYFWMYSDDLTSQIEPVDTQILDSEEDNQGLSTENGAENYSFDDVQFYQDFLSSGQLQSKYVNTFRLYHLNGAHAPFTMTENATEAENGASTEEQQMDGCMKIVLEYIDEMKKNGVYDNSLIIITADHGRAGDGKGIQQNPCVLIKSPNEKHDLKMNDMPIHFRNVLATEAESFLKDYSNYGPSVYDINENSDVERLHTVASPVCEEGFPDIAKENTFARFVISENARDVEAIRYYNAKEINKIDYKIGDIIDFSNQSELSNQINYRIYKENSQGVMSNEFTMYLNLLNYSGGNLYFNFTCSKVYNDEQKMRIYVEGEKVADLECTSDDVGKEFSVKIPADRIRNKALPIRIVFPNAVTPKQIGQNNKDTRVLSVAFNNMFVRE